MFLIQRRADSEIMPRRQSADWGKYKQLADMQAHLASLPPNEVQSIADTQQAIASLEAERDDWYAARCTELAAKYGGVASDYQVVGVPSGEESQALFARHIIYDGDTFTYDLNPAYSVDGPVVTCHPGWVYGLHRLLADDVTDFTGLATTESVYFQLVYAQVDATQLITIQLLTRFEDEEFADLPVGLTHRGIACQGRVNIDNSIDIGEF